MSTEPRQHSYDDCGTPDCYACASQERERESAPAQPQADLNDTDPAGRWTGPLGKAVPPAAETAAQDFTELSERIGYKIQSLLSDKYTNSLKIVVGIIEQELRKEQSCGTAQNAVISMSAGTLPTATDASPSEELLSSPQKIATARSAEELDKILNEPEPNVIVNRDGTCTAAETAVTAEQLRSEFEKILSPAVNCNAPYAKVMVTMLIKTAEAKLEKAEAAERKLAEQDDQIAALKELVERYLGELASLRAGRTASEIEECEHCGLYLAVLNGALVHRVTLHTTCPTAGNLSGRTATVASLRAESKDPVD